MTTRNLLLVLHIAGVAAWLGANLVQAVLSPRTGSFLARAGLLHRPGQKAMTLDELDSADAEAAIESGTAGSRRSK